MDNLFTLCKEGTKQGAEADYQSQLPLSLVLTGTLCLLANKRTKRSPAKTMTDGELPLQRTFTLLENYFLKIPLLVLSIASQGRVSYIRFSQD